MIRLDLYGNERDKAYVFYVCPATGTSVGYSELSGANGAFRWILLSGVRVSPGLTVTDSFWDKYGTLRGIQQHLHVVKIGFLDLDTGIAYMDAAYPVNNGD